jgi:predicted transcriptional regulator YdeE
MMNKVKIYDTHLVGLPLKEKTVNANGQSGIDCGNLWQEFIKNNVAASIPNKISDELFAVYYEYEGDYTKPFLYFIGCKVQANTEAPAGLENLVIPAGSYHKLTAKGQMPEFIVHAWKEIWASDIPRIYQVDFEVYDERSKDWNNAEVDIYLSVEQ